MTEPVIRPVGPDEEERAIAAQTMAFSGDPVMRWLYPEPEGYLSHFPRFARAFGGRAFEHGTAYATDCFGGASLWLPVDAHADGEAIENVFRESLDRSKFGETLELLEKMDEFHIEEPHWYLAVIGVDPAKQGRGIGAALLRHSLAPCDEQGLPAYLESSNPANLSLYRRHGFEVIGEIQVGSSPSVFPMLREPR